MDSEHQPEQTSIHEEQTIEVPVSGLDSDSDSESEIGSPIPLRAPQPRTVSLIPTVHIEMAGTPSPIPSPGNPVDCSLLSPPEHRRFTSKPRTPKPRRPASAPPTIVTFDNQVTCFVENWDPEPQEEIHRSSLQDIRPGDLIRPTPLLFRPTTFWRKIPRSGVRSASYSPSSHLIRRSTFIAAGLSLDQPVDDISAFGVESRVGVIILPSDIPI
ncbi:hypothetical protein QCA50_014981 [Cerrena zonata]|uniref:Uncharacterized protein n=1 Tax=Cerrena zonata TaxID=2478898 RepID=A0AAW0FXH8_9APHY